MSGFSVCVDLGNPGQLLACCGLLEAADRLWRDDAFVTAWFKGDRFHVDAPGNISALMDWLLQASVKGVEEKIASGRGDKAGQRDFVYFGSGDDAGILIWPNGCQWRLNSWSGEDFGCTRIKTFAGQMKGPKVLAHLLDWARKMKFEEHFFDTSLMKGGASVFGFDARKGRSALDLGFSPDALKMGGENFPMVELFAAIGLQGVRPKRCENEKTKRENLLFGVWGDPLPVELARPVASCAFELPNVRRFQFRLVGRKERGGVAGAPNDQYKAFTRAWEIVKSNGGNDE